MVKLVMTRGVPGSGKSYWASRQEGFVVVCKDDIREELEKTGWTWSRENERDVKDKQESLISSYLMSGKSVIAADTNFGKHEGRLRQLAQKCGAEFEVKDFTNVPIEVCLERNAKREKSVPEKVIWKMYNQYVRKDVDNSNKAKVEWIDGLPTAVICDLDGTIAIHDGRSPYDTSKCMTDKVNWNVMKIVTALELSGYEIIFMSGRDEEFRKQTEDWLAEKADWQGNDTGLKLYMRPRGDRRNDAIVKNELFDAHVRGKYNVVCVLDDRDRVVKMWRELGLTCLQVNYGNF